MKYTIDKRLAYQEIEGQLYIVSPWDHKLHKINPSGRFIWQFIEKGLSQQNIIQNIIGEFDVSKIQAEQDFSEFIEKMVKKGLIYTNEEPLHSS
ncbi:MAG: PqqD family protein [bacterium]